MTVVGRGHRPPSGHIPFTPQAKTVLELSLREAQRLEHEYIGSEHLLLALIREGTGTAAHVLAGLGIDLERARRFVADRDAPDPDAPSPTVPSRAARWAGCPV